MGQPAKLNFKIYQGSTFNEVIRWESDRKVYKEITNITQAAPCIVTATLHGVPDGWRIKLTNVGGMTEINSPDTFVRATKLDANSIELNDVNSKGFKPYTSDGIIEYKAPVDLTGYTARMQIREKIDSTTVLDELTSENSGIVIDTVNYGIIISISALDTAAYTFNTAVYSLEMVSATGVVTTIAVGTLTLVKEITK